MFYAFWYLKSLVSCISVLFFIKPTERSSSLCIPARIMHAVQFCDYVIILADLYSVIYYL
ncbi:hypothetical protein V1511DRAFT_507322 [Dipodascopsis uninucleata]